MHWGIGVLGHWCIGTLMYWGIGVLEHWCIGALVYWGIVVLGHWCIGTLVYWCTETNMVKINKASGTGLNIIVCARNSRYIP